MKIDRQTLIALVVVLAFGWWLGHSPKSPVGPPPEPDRPVVRAFGKIARTAARLGLWFALAGEQAPERPHAEDVGGPQLVRAKAPVIGADGHPELDHAEGF